MKIEFLSRSVNQLENSDWRDVVQVLLDGSKVFEVGDGEPEDANLSRDFNDVFKLPEIFQQIFDAGKHGEELEIIHRDLDD